MVPRGWNIEEREINENDVTFQYNHQKVESQTTSTVETQGEILKEIPRSKRSLNCNSCDQCGYITYRKSNLIRHLQTHHRKLEDEKQNHQQKTEGGMKYEDNEKDINDLKLERLSQKAISQNTDSSIQKHTKKYPKNTK